MYNHAVSFYDGPKIEKLDHDENFSLYSILFHPIYCECKLLMISTCHVEGNFQKLVIVIVQK